MARAMLYADATVVLPMDFLRVPLTAAAGWLIYSERLEMFTLLGAALILAGNLLNLRAADPVPARAGAWAVRSPPRLIIPCFLEPLAQSCGLDQLVRGRIEIARSSTGRRHSLGDKPVFLARRLAFFV